MTTIQSELSLVITNPQFVNLAATALWEVTVSVRTTLESYRATG